MTGHSIGEGIPSPEFEKPEDTLEGQVFTAIGREDLLRRDIRLPSGEIVPAHMFHRLYGDPTKIEDSKDEMRGWLELRASQPDHPFVLREMEQIAGRVETLNGILVPLQETTG